MQSLNKELIEKIRNLVPLLKVVPPGRTVQRFKVGDNVWFYSIKEGAWDKGTVVGERTANNYEVRGEDRKRRLISGRDLRHR